MIPIADLKKTFPNPGRVEWIGIAHERYAPIQVVDSVQVRLRTGIVGDHHAKGGNSKRQVTLIQAEHLAVIASLLHRDSVPPELLRRNIVVSGVNLIALKGCAIQIGNVVLKGTGPCVPCSRMEYNLGPGGYNAVRGHGGLNTVVVESGTISVGDSVEFHPSPEKEAENSLF